MKLIRIMVILVFAAIILAPVAAFHLKEDAISVIDNRRWRPTLFQTRLREI